MDQRAKKKYSKPTISDWGSVADLTRAGNTRPGGDTFGGSVLAPGLDNAPGLGTAPGQQ